MQDFYQFIERVSGFIWGGTWGDAQVLPLPPMVVVLLGSGFVFMILLRFMPLRRLWGAAKELWMGRKAQGSEGEITPWQALSTALSGQVGTGNLAGVASAITLGGPGAILWMWITAFFGMAVAFAESSLAVKYRERHPDGRVHGGPMYYIKNGLGKAWLPLAVLFCLGTLFSATSTGSMIQSNSIANATTEATRTIAHALPCQIVVAKTSIRIDGDFENVRSGGCAVDEALEAGTPVEVSFDGESYAVPAEQFILEMTPALPGIVLAALVFAVIIGGIKSIGSVAGKVVPVMAVFYIMCAIAVLLLNAPEVPAAFMQIFTYAFGFEQAAGGIVGYGVMEAVRYGVARGLFSNEAGQGSTPIAHAAAQTDNPVRQGEIAMLGTFIDTIIICTMTALVIMVVQGDFVSGSETVAYAWQSQTLEGVEVTSAAYREGLPFGGVIIAISLALFSFTTILGWSYYGEQAVTFLVGDWAAKPFRFLWVVVVFIGALQPIDFVWRLGDISNASMAFPNLIAILALSGVVVTMARDEGRIGGGKAKPASG